MRSTSPSARARSMVRGDIKTDITGQLGTATGTTAVTGGAIQERQSTRETIIAVVRGVTIIDGPRTKTTIMIGIPRAARIQSVGLEGLAAETSLVVKVSCKDHPIVIDSCRIEIAQSPGSVVSGQRCQD